MDLASLAGIAKPMPMLPLWPPPAEDPSEVIALLMPTSSDVPTAASSHGVRDDGVGGRLTARSGRALWLRPGGGRGDGPVEGADDARGHCSGEPQRVPDRHDGLSDDE